MSRSFIVFMIFVIPESGTQVYLSLLNLNGEMMQGSIRLCPFSMDVLGKGQTSLN
jgi:hypothetical protein